MSRREIFPFGRPPSPAITRSHYRRLAAVDNFALGLRVENGVCIPPSPYHDTTVRPDYNDSSGDSADRGSYMRGNDSSSEDSDSDSADSDSRSEKEAQLQPVQVQFHYHKWDKVLQCYVDATLKRTFELQFVYTSSDEEEWLPEEMEAGGQPAVEEEAGGQPAVESESRAQTVVEEEGVHSTPATQSQRASHRTASHQPSAPPSAHPNQQLSARRVSYRAAIKLPTPPKFMGDGKVSLEDWRLKMDNYCQLTEADQNPEYHQSVVASLLGANLETAWLSYRAQQQEPQTVDQLYQWLARNTVAVDRKEDILDDLDKLSWSFSQINQSATKVASILARGAGDPVYAYTAPTIVRVVERGMRSNGLGDLFREVQFMPAVGGEAPKAWTDTTLFLSYLTALHRKWGTQQQQPKRDTRQQGQSRGSEGGGSGQKRRGDQHDADRGKQPRKEPLPQPSANLALGLQWVVAVRLI